MRNVWTASELVRIKIMVYGVRDRVMLSVVQTSVVQMFCPPMFGNQMKQLFPRNAEHVRQLRLDEGTHPAVICVWGNLPQYLRLVIIVNSSASGRDDPSSLCL